MPYAHLERFTPGPCGPMWVPRPPAPPGGSALRHSVVVTAIYARHKRLSMFPATVAHRDSGRSWKRTWGRPAFQHRPVDELWRASLRIYSADAGLHCWLAGGPAHGAPGDPGSTCDYQYRGERL